MASIGGDSDTIACIAGGIAEIVHALPDTIALDGRAFLSDRLNATVNRFREAILHRV